MADGVWTKRLSKTALRCGIMALVIGVGGPLIAGWDMISKMAGVYCIFGATLIAAIGAIAGLIAVALNLRNKSGMLVTALIGLVLSGGFAGFMASRAAVAGQYPPIHDVTTNLASPPSFVKLKLGADNLRGVDTVEKWRTLHAKAYGNIRPIVLTKVPAAVIADAERLATERGWKIVNVDETNGVFEATASVSLIKYQDDVVLTASATPDGTGTIVNMRSVSRVGISDLGVNAKRIREFLAALKKA